MRRDTVAAWTRYQLRPSAVRHAAWHSSSMDSPERHGRPHHQPCDVVVQRGRIIPSRSVQPFSQGSDCETTERVTCVAVVRCNVTSWYNEFQSFHQPYRDRFRRFCNARRCAQLRQTDSTDHATRDACSSRPPQRGTTRPDHPVAVNHAFSVLFFSRPRSEGWPQHERTFSIHPCPLSF